MGLTGLLSLVLLRRRIPRSPPLSDSAGTQIKSQNELPSRSTTDWEAMSHRETQ